MKVNVLNINNTAGVKNYCIQNARHFDTTSFAQKYKSQKNSPPPSYLNGTNLSKQSIYYDALKREIEKFALDKSNVEYIGSGLCANAYAFKRYPNIAIKESLKGTDDFHQEEKNLKKAPKDLKHVQKFIARTYNKKNKSWYLLSTRVKGDIPNPVTNPWTKEHLESLFESMYIMDKHAFYHGDLNACNILLDDEANANLIDFQYSYELPKDKWFKEKENSTTPDFIYNENALMYEQAAIPEYLFGIKNSDEAKEFFKLYLSQKAEYHKNRYEFLLEATKNWQNKDELPIIRKSLAFERSRAQLFKNPSDEIIKIEAKKINFLNAFRDAYAKIDGDVENKNIIPASAYYLYTLSAIQDFRNTIQRELEKDPENYDTIAYLNAMEAFGDFWFDKIKSWSDGALMYPLRHANKLKYDWEGELFDFQNEKVDFNKFGNTSDLAQHIDENYKPMYTKAFSFKDDGYLNPLIIISACTEKLKLKNPDEKISDKIEEIKALNIKLVKAMRARHLTELINYSILGIVRAKELEEINKETDNLEELNEYSKTIRTQYSNFAVFSYINAYDEIVNDDPRKGELTGYNNMGHFAN